AVVNLFLHPSRHGRGRPLNVKFAGVGGFRLQKYLMTLLVAETHHLVFYAGAVTWTYAVYGTVVQRRQMFVLQNYAFCFLRGIGEVATAFCFRKFFRHEGK